MNDASGSLRIVGYLRQATIICFLIGLTLLAGRADAFPTDLEPGARGITPLSDAADAFGHHTLPKADFSRLLAGYLNHESPLDRIAAMRLVGSERIDGFDDRLWQLADDPLWPVAYTALWALTKITPQAGQGRIAEKATAHWATSINVLAVRIASPELAPLPIPNRDGWWIADLQGSADRREDRCPKREFSWSGAWHTFVGQRVAPVSREVMQVPPFHVPEMGGWTGGTWDVDKDANGRDTVALALGDSLLVGLCWGEFGGTLLELPRPGKPTFLRSGDMCITGLYETNQGLIAVGGIEHVMHQPAELFALKRGENGAWQQRLLAVTEIARAERMMLDDGTLVVRDLGGILALGEDGRFTRLECR